MPRIDKSMLKNSNGSFQIGSERTTAEEVLSVPVFQNDAELFVGFVGDVYDSIESMYAAANAQAVGLPFTKEELVKYAFTGMRSRLARVNNERFDVRCDDPWQMPAILAAIINSIGRVEIEAPVITMVPTWNVTYDEFVMTRSDWHRVTQLLRGVVRNDMMKLVVVNALAGDKAGDEMLLSLIPVRDDVGRIVRIAHRTQPVDPIAAAVYVIAGFAPEIYAGVSLGLHPLLLPPHYIAVGALRQNLWRLSDVA
jgi:hypothetical protein